MSQTRATAEPLVRPGPPPPRAAPSRRAEHDPFPSLPSRGGAGRGFDACGSSGPPTAAEPVPEFVALPPSAPAQPAVSYLEKVLANTRLKDTRLKDTRLKDTRLKDTRLKDTRLKDTRLKGTRLKDATSSPILVRKPPDWYLTYYIRTDRDGYCHTYPALSGPFKSLQLANNAIDCHLLDLQDPKMSEDSLGKLSLLERAVQESLYWPDGTRQKCLEPPDESHDEILLLVQAIVDQYNADHGLLGDVALQLEDVLRRRFFFSKGDKYYHFNFTAWTEGVVEFFFAEVQCTQGEHEEMVVSCFCVVKPSDDGCCYGCKNNGAVDMKHPNKAAYCPGRIDEYLPLLGGYHIETSYLAESVEDEEKRLRCQYEVESWTRAILLGVGVGVV